MGTYFVRLGKIAWLTYLPKRSAARRKEPATTPDFPRRANAMYDLQRFPWRLAESPQRSVVRQRIFTGGALPCCSFLGASAFSYLHSSPLDLEITR